MKRSHADMALAFWCPHGMDSSRAGEYITADTVRSHLAEIRAALRDVPGTEEET